MLVSTYLNYDQEECDKVNHIAKEEEKILSSVTVIFANITTLYYHLIPMYRGRTM